MKKIVFILLSLSLVLFVNMSCTNETTLTVDPPPTASISADPGTIQIGESATLTWSTTNADTCIIEPGVGSVDINGSTAVTPTETTTYTITVTDPGGTITDCVTVNVNDPSAPPTVNIDSTPVTIAKGESSTLSWTSTNAQSAHIDNGIGSVSPDGAISVSPEYTTTYTIAVTGSTGSTDATITVMVTGNPDPQPEGSFGNQYNDLIPPDATVDEYAPKRFSLITGFVQSMGDSSISGVSVTIHGHPEYGTVSTGEDGGFSIPVEGGGTMTVIYQKDGLIPAQRQVYVPWNDIAIVETIRMIAEDTASTTLTFDGSPQTVVTHRSTEVTDESGSRSCSMIFTGDNTAYLVDKDGNDVRELTTITVRATEFTTSESMPAILPPNSAYTYCAELTVDGAQRVRFEKLVITWINNFLGFDVGEIVPVGYYDRDRGLWVPSENGVVVKLLDTDSDGIVDALDADGDDQPDDLNEDGLFSDEVIGLDDPEKYAPDATFWRAAVTHFTPSDCNWPFGFPGDAVSPNPKGEPNANQQEDGDCLHPGCVVEARSRIIHEDILIPGTGMTLHYAGNRVTGYKTVITIPASGETVPESLKSIIVKVEVAGRNFEQTLAPLPDQGAEFIWDGLDHLGRHVSGVSTAHITTGFVYDSVYWSAGAASGEAFAQAGVEPTLVSARQEVILWRKSEIDVHRRCFPSFIAEGYTLSAYHYGNSILYKGNGTVIRNNVLVIDTVAGNGVPSYDGNDCPATEAELCSPVGVAVDSSGNLYIADRNNHRVRRVNANGIIITVAGTEGGYGGYSGDGGLATEARLSYPEGVAVDSSGNLYIADGMNRRIRKVDISGIITTVVGDGEWGYSGDGGLATEARIGWPVGVTVDSSGNLYIADHNNNCVRRVDTTGIIITVAGTGEEGYSGDGGPAIEANLYRPTGVAMDSLGNLYIADCWNRRVRKVAPHSAFAGATAIGDIPFVEESGLGYIMSSAGLHRKTIDLDTGIVLREFGYDEDNSLISITDQFNNQTTINRDADGTPVFITSPDGLVTALTIDTSNHLTRIAYPDGSNYDFEYTEDSLMTAKIEPAGNRFEHVFDVDGRLTDATDEEGGDWNYERTVLANSDILAEVTTGEGNVTSYLDHTYSTGRYISTITDATSSETLYTRSADGLTVDKLLPCGMTFGFKYGVDAEYKFKYVKKMSEITPSSLEKTILRDKAYEDTNSDDIPDLITQTVTINGKPTILENSTLQSKKTITSPEGRAVTINYDPVNLLTINVNIPGFFDTAYGYDDKGRPTFITTNTRTTGLTYSARGFVSSITDPENHTTTYSHDPVGRVTGISRPDGSSLGFIYDMNGNMEVLTTPSGVDHIFGYNSINRNDLYQTPISGSYGYMYDKDKRLIRTSFPSGKQINNVYDKTRLMQIQTPEGNIDLTYLCGTKVGSITGGVDTITYGYDGKLVTTETIAGTLNKTLSYTYNSDFNIDSFTYASNTAGYTFDNDGFLTGAGSFTITRNSGNGLPEAVTGGNLAMSRSFNGYGNVSSEDFTINSNNVTSWNLTRDDNGRITQKAETIDGITTNYAYTYDSMGRLLTVTKNNIPVEEYRYDLNGTRNYEMNALRGIAGRSFTYSDEDHLLTAGTAVYQYTVDGFLMTRTDGTGKTQYEYSSRGELLGITLPDGTEIEYMHDPLGRRIAKEINGTITEKYLWQGLTRLLAIYDGSDTLKMRFEYADSRMPIAMTRGGSTYYLTYDQVGLLRIVADSAGNVVERIDYDSFGNVITDTAPSFEVPFGFAGGLHDKDTKLVRFGYRDYDPDIGRWTAKDPILFAGGDTDLYGYCLNDPVNLVDLEGEKGGILLPIRIFLKKHMGADDILGPIFEKTLNIPYTPLGVFLYIMSPTEAGDPYADYFLTLPPSDSYDPMWWLEKREEYDGRLKFEQGPC